MPQVPAKIVSLNLPHDSAGVFLDYLNSQLPTRMTSATGSAEYKSDGSFNSFVTGPFNTVEGRTPQLTFHILKAGDGRLISLEILRDADSDWRAQDATALDDFITDVLTAALAERKTTFFMRSPVHYIGSLLDGEYWFGQVRVAPAWPEDDTPHLINAERVLWIDQNIDAVDGSHASGLARLSSARIAARLSLLLNIGLYHPPQEMRWVQMPESTRSIRTHLMFYGYGAESSGLPQKGVICPPGRYRGSLTDPYRLATELLSLPREARRVFRAIDSAPARVGDAFDRSARLYQVAAVVGHSFPSVGLAYRVAAVEALSKADEGINSFGDFMRMNVRPVENLNSLLEYLYGTVRSAHFHAGHFPLGEFDRPWPMSMLMDDEYVRQSQIQRMAFALTREAIVNWVLRQLPPDADN